jgi:hypothetical protein
MDSNIQVGSDSDVGGWTPDDTPRGTDIAYDTSALPLALAAQPTDGILDATRPLDVLGGPDRCVSQFFTHAGEPTTRAHQALRDCSPGTATSSRPFLSTGGAGGAPSRWV